MLRGNHDHGRGVTSHHAREDGCVNYEEIVSTVDLGVLIYHGSATEAAVVETNLSSTCIVARLAEVHRDLFILGNIYPSNDSNDGLRQSPAAMKVYQQGVLVHSIVGWLTLFTKSSTVTFGAGWIHVKFGTLARAAWMFLMPMMTASLSKSLCR